MAARYETVSRAGPWFRSPVIHDIGLFLLRVVAGGMLMQHGGQKLFVFGFDGVAGAFAGMGIPMAGILGPFVAFVEFFGGLALVTGLLTRLASLGLASTMIVAIPNERYVLSVAFLTLSVRVLIAPA